VPAAEHRARIESLRARIAAGDLYQANLAHRLTLDLRGDPLDLYLRLRRVNPAPYMAFLRWDASTGARGARCPDGALLSASPELLLEFDGARAVTRPIKGTAAREADAGADARAANALLESAKDLAELAMIVDLERNDLGRCARPGGVRVEAFPRLETYATVHHLVADVAADVRPEVDAFDLLAALFPGGSITGAPKLASMEAIARLEGEGRGFFTGSLGFVDSRGHAAWNILIRTLVWRPRDADGEVSFHVGGGITWSSDAAAEERETSHKGAGLLRALQGTES
jgi:para-aminobenzoate synthetase component 1